MSSYDKDYDYNLQILDGKKDKEIIEICKKYFGEIIAGPYVATGVFETSRRDPTSLTEDHLAERIARIEDDRYSDAYLDDNGMEHVVLDPSYDGRFGITPFKTEVIQALKEEIDFVFKDPLYRGFNEDTLSREEIERRLSIVIDLCTKHSFEEYIPEKLAHWLFLESEAEIKKSYANNPLGLYYHLEKDLPTFFNVVNILKEKGFDLKDVRMFRGYSLADLYNMAYERFGKFIVDDKVVDEETAKAIISGEQVKQDTSSVEPEVTVNSDKTDPIELLDSEANKKKQEIEEKKQLLNILNDKLKELDSLDSQIADLDRQIAERMEKLNEKGVSL